MGGFKIPWSLRTIARAIWDNNYIPEASRTVDLSSIPAAEAMVEAAVIETAILCDGNNQTINFPFTVGNDNNAFLDFIGPYDGLTLTRLEFATSTTGRVRVTYTGSPTLTMVFRVAEFTGP